MSPESPDAHHDDCGSGDRYRTPRFLTPGEVDRLIRRARGTVYHAIIYVLVRTGMRTGELARLRWEDVDLDGRVVYVGGRGGETTAFNRDGQDTQDGERISARPVEPGASCASLLNAVPLSDRRRCLARRAMPLDDELARVISRQPGGPAFKDPGRSVSRRARRSLMRRAAAGPAYVFATECGGPRIHGMERGIRRVAELAGLEAAGRTGVGPRMLRHTFAAQLVMSGADTGALREFLGYTRAEHLARYRSLSPVCRTSWRIPRGRPIRPGRAEDREHLDGRKRRAVEAFRPRTGIPRELEEVERQIGRLEDETRALARCMRARQILRQCAGIGERDGAAEWLDVLLQDADEPDPEAGPGRDMDPAEYSQLVEDAELVKNARLARDAQLAWEARLREAFERIDRGVRDWIGRLVPELGLTIRMFGRVIRGGGPGPSGSPGRPRPAEEVTREVKHVLSARAVTSGGREYTRPVRERAAGPPGEAGGIPYGEN